jgi:hypothetical protein
MNRLPPLESQDTGLQIGYSNLTSTEVGVAQSLTTRIASKTDAKLEVLLLIKRPLILRWLQLILGALKGSYGIWAMEWVPYS